MARLDFYFTSLLSSRTQICVRSLPDAVVIGLYKRLRRVKGGLICVGRGLFYCGIFGSGVNFRVISGISGLVICKAFC